MLASSSSLNPRALTIGLFGTCDKSRWREAFIARYEALGIPYFNPQVPALDWTPQMAALEAEHLAQDGLILFPITSESYATGSLAETGFAILSAIRANTSRYIILWIAQELDAELIAHNALAARESLRARALVAAHLAQHRHPNVFLVDSLPSMLEASVELHRSLQALSRVREPAEAR